MDNVVNVVCKIIAKYFPQTKRNYQLYVMVFITVKTNNKVCIERRDFNFVIIHSQEDSFSAAFPTSSLPLQPSQLYQLNS